MLLVHTCECEGSGEVKQCEQRQQTLGGVEYGALARMYSQCPGFASAESQMVPCMSPCLFRLNPCFNSWKRTTPSLKGLQSRIGTAKICENG